MKTPPSKSWSLRLVTLTVWLLAVLCGAYWALKFVTVKPFNAAAAAATPPIVVDSLAVAKLLGATNSIAEKAIITPASSNYALFGLAVTSAGTGVALIATDGKPAKPYRIGSQVADDWVLKSVSRTEAILATAVNAPDGMKLELPARRPASVAIGAPTSAPMQFQAPSTAAPGLVTPPAEPLVKRPVSRFAPSSQSELSTTGRIPFSPPSASAPVTAVPTPRP